MTVKDLFNAWFHKRNLDSKMIVWDRNIGEFVFDSKDVSARESALYSIEEIENTEVGCFNQYYDNKLNKEVLIINVDNIGGIKK